MRNGRSGRKKNTNKFISLILRHKPEVIGISLNEHGWADVEDLIAGVNQAEGHSLNMEFVYVDAHYCLNDARYVYRDRTGLHMTEEARRSMDRRCLALELTPSETYDLLDLAGPRLRDQDSHAVFAYVIDCGSAYTLGEINWLLKENKQAPLTKLIVPIETKGKRRMG